MDCSARTQGGVVVAIVCTALTAIGFYAFVKIIKGKKKKLAEKEEISI